MFDLHSVKFLLVRNMYRSFSDIRRLLMFGIANNILSNSNHLPDFSVHHPRANEKAMLNIGKDSRFYTVCSIFQIDQRIFKK